MERKRKGTESEPSPSKKSLNKNKAAAGSSKNNEAKAVIDGLTCLLCNEPYERKPIIPIPEIYDFRVKQLMQKGKPLIPDHLDPVLLFTVAVVTFGSLLKLKRNEYDEEKRGGDLDLSFYSGHRRASDHPCCGLCYKKLENLIAITKGNFEVDAAQNENVSKCLKEIAELIESNAAHSNLRPVWKPLRRSLLQFVAAGSKEFEEITDAAAASPVIFKLEDNDTDDSTVEDEGEQEIDFVYWYEKVKEEPKQISKPIRPKESALGDNSNANKTLQQPPVKPCSVVLTRLDQERERQESNEYSGVIHNVVSLQSNENLMKTGPEMSQSDDIENTPAEEASNKKITQANKRKLEFFEKLEFAGCNQKFITAALYIYLEEEIPPDDFHEVVELMASQKKLEVFNKQNRREPPLHLAIKRCEISSKTLDLLQSANIKFNQELEDGRGVLHYAIEGNRSCTLLKDLIKKGADVNVQGYLEDCPIKLALLHKAPMETIECLVDNGLDLRKFCSSNKFAKIIRHLQTERIHRFSVLKLQAEKIKTKLFISCFDAGLSYVIENCLKYPILQFAVEHGSLEVVKYLLEKGVDVNETNSFGNTAFLQAMRCGPSGIEKAEMLRSFGADIYVKQRGATAIEKACDPQGSVEAVTYCLNLGFATNKEDLLYRVLSTDEFMHGDIKQLDKAKILMMNGADVNEKFDDEHLKRNPALHLALEAFICSKSYEVLEFINLLLEMGADINATRVYGRTAIHIAMGASPEVALKLTDFLLKRGADITRKTDSGQTALHIAARTRNPDIVELCSKKGLEVDALDSEGKTPLDYALPDQHAGNVQYLNEDDYVKTVKLLLKQKPRWGIVTNLKQELNMRLNIAKRLNYAGQVEVLCKLKEMFDNYPILDFDN